MAATVLVVTPTMFFFFYSFAKLPLSGEVLTSLFRSIAPEATNFGATSLPTVANSSGTVVALLVLINNSPNSATNNVGAAALTILVLDTFSIYHGGSSTRIYNEHVSNSAIGGTTTITMVCFLLFFINNVIVDATRNLPLDAYLCRATSTIKAIKLALKVAPRLNILSRLVLVILVCLNEINKLALVCTTISGGGRDKTGLPLRGVAIKWEDCCVVGGVLLVNLNEFNERVTLRLGGLKRRIVTMSVGRREIGRDLPVIAGTRVNSDAGARFLESLNVKGFSIYVIAVNKGFRGSLRAASLLGRLNTGLIMSHTRHSIRRGFLLQGKTSRIVCPRGRMTG